MSKPVNLICEECDGSYPAEDFDITIADNGDIDLTCPSGCYVAGCTISSFTCCVEIADRGQK